MLLQIYNSNVKYTLSDYKNKVERVFSYKAVNKNVWLNTGVHLAFYNPL